MFEKQHFYSIVKQTAFNVYGTVVAPQTNEHA